MSPARAAARAALTRLDNCQTISNIIGPKHAESSSWRQFVRKELNRSEKMVLILMIYENYDAKTIEANLGIPTSQIDSLLESVGHRFEELTGSDKPPTEILGLPKAAV